MEIPLDAAAVRHAESSTRQKSCNNCVKAKRGCDKHHPACSRCVEKSIPCIYAKRPYSEAFPVVFDLDPAQLDPLTLDNSASSMFSPSHLDVTFGDTMTSYPGIGAATSLEGRGIDVPLDPFLDFVGDNQTATPSSDMWPTYRTIGQLEEVPALITEEDSEEEQICVSSLLALPCRCFMTDYRSESPRAMADL